MEGNPRGPHRDRRASQRPRHARKGHFAPEKQDFSSDFAGCAMANADAARGESRCWELSGLRSQSTASLRVPAYLRDSNDGAL
eukprot:1235098-Rhodomonas_salina.2